MQLLLPYLAIAKSRTASPNVRIRCRIRCASRRSRSSACGSVRSLRRVPELSRTVVSLSTRIADAPMPMPSGGNPLQDLSDNLAGIVERVGPRVVAVHGRHRIPSSGVIGGMASSSQRRTRSDTKTGSTSRWPIAGPSPRFSRGRTRAPTSPCSNWMAWTSTRSSPAMPARSRQAIWCSRSRATALPPSHGYSGSDSDRVDPELAGNHGCQARMTSAHSENGGAIGNRLACRSHRAAASNDGVAVM